ncbi:MAG: hypothetical protein ABSA74_01015 [Candidatus Staskawiczbacteria bacterium]|jgi:hypothetical protein
MLPKKAIDEFKKLYLKNYGIELSDKEATRRAENFVGLYDAVYGDDPRLFRASNQQEPNKTTP